MFYSELFRGVNKMNEEVIKKYVKDLDGLLQEIEKIPLLEVYREDLIYHGAIIFIFGRLYDFFNFDYISFERKGLDAFVRTLKGDTMSLEFEVFSKSFMRDHLKDIKKDEKVLIVCWEDNWMNPPENIDIIELRQFWRIEK